MPELTPEERIDNHLRYILDGVSVSQGKGNHTPYDHQQEYLDAIIEAEKKFFGVLNGAGKTWTRELAVGLIRRLEDG